MIRVALAVVASILLASCTVLDCAGEADRGGYSAGCAAEIRF